MTATGTGSGTGALRAPPERGIFCNRTLNLRSIRAIGYDMDYTLIHYRPEYWERAAYQHLKQRLEAQGWPVSGLEFQPDSVVRGLIIDTERGNLLKANRFGFVRKAAHGTRMMDYDAQRAAYARTQVDLHEDRWVFLNTLFSLSEACMYAQLVDLLDQRKLPEVLGYADLYRRVRHLLDAAHMEGRLKAEILAAPERFVVQEEQTALALLDQKRAGKKLLLITNSEWAYTASMMAFAFDRFLPAGMTWRELFDVVIVGAGKPAFFTASGQLFEVVTADGLLRPSISGLRGGAVFLGGSAQHVEQHLGLSGDEILYVGDHMFGDVHVTKNVLRWRTALILRELEEEVLALQATAVDEARLSALMAEKEGLEAALCEARLMLQRKKFGYAELTGEPEAAIGERMSRLRQGMNALDDQIAPLAKAATERSNPTWGLLMRAGNDKSHLARQVERYADIYTSRVSNLMYATPFAFLRSPRGSLPHDPVVPGGRGDATMKEAPET
jgi:HAD superfamily 5'-nucleotidase-like hydrolase